MDTKWKKWLNFIAVFIVIIIMSVTGVYGAIECNKLGMVDGTISLDSLEDSRESLFSDTASALIFQWVSEKQGVSNSTTYKGIFGKKELKEILRGAVVEAKLKIKPYGKKMKTIRETYGAKEADYQEGKITGIRIERDASQKVKPDGSFADTQTEDDEGAEAFYRFSSIYNKSDLSVNIPEELLINSDKKQRLENGTITVKFTKKCTRNIETYYKDRQKELQNIIKTAIVLAGIECFGAILLIILFALQERRTRFFAGIDRIWWEVIAMLVCSVMIAGGTLFAAVFDFSRQYSSSSGNTIQTSTVVETFMIISFMVIPCIVVIFAVCVQTTVWRIKQKKLLDTTLCFGYFRKWYRLSKERKRLEYEAMSFAKQHEKDRIKQYRTARKILIVFIFLSICSIPYLSFFGVGMAILGVAAVRCLIRYSEQYAKEQKNLCKLIDQIDRISNGELTAQADIPKGTIYYDYSQKLSNIGNGMEKALQEQMRGEKMKIDLITNVSHDLKTPLTSIIGYVDLLGKDETLSPESRDYVQILNKKTERLKNIIADLFELAKATSGDMKVNLEEMDMRRLMEQTLADMEDKIHQAGFIIRFECHAKQTKFMGDVNRMYRVVQNVMENALKYSLKGTRIFVDIYEDPKSLWMEVVNTASYEMNFTEEEIMERFARAEKSRTSEGNGLGLSIADSFTKNCGGSFKISIKGDQFRVKIIFDKINNEKKR